MIDHLKKNFLVTSATTFNLADKITTFIALTSCPNLLMKGFGELNAMAGGSMETIGVLNAILLYFGFVTLLIIGTNASFKFIDKLLRRHIWNRWADVALKLNEAFWAFSKILYNVLFASYALNNIIHILLMR